MKPAPFYEAVVRHFSPLTGWVCDTLYVQALSLESAKLKLKRWYNELPEAKKKTYRYNEDLQILSVLEREVIR
jgi:hypothetical protein